MRKRLRAENEGSEDLEQAQAHARAMLPYAKAHDALLTGDLEAYRNAPAPLKA